MTFEEIQANLRKLRPQHPQETGLRSGETVKILEELLSMKQAEQQTALPD